MSINRKGGSKPGPEHEIRPPEPPPRVVQTPEGQQRAALGRQVIDLQRKLSEAETFVLSSLPHERVSDRVCASFCKRCALVKILKED